MKINRRTFAFLMAGVLSLCAVGAFGGIRQLPPGARPPAGYGWCPRCEGCRYVPSGFLGWTSKPCPDCHATGLVLIPPPPPPPPPKPVTHHKKHHHHHQPAPAAHHQPAPTHHQPAPTTHRQPAQPSRQPAAQPHDGRDSKRGQPPRR